MPPLAPRSEPSDRSLSGPTTSQLFVGVLNDIHDRMSRLNPDSYETNGQSDEGGEKLFHELEHLLQELYIIEL